MHRATIGRQRGSLKANFDAPQAKVSLSGPFGDRVAPRGRGVSSVLGLSDVRMSAMNSSDGGFGGTWPDQDERSRWHEALAGAAQRLRAERGVDDPWRLTVGWGALWAEYGDLRLRVAGEGAEPRAPDDLFDEIDSWVAFDRIAGPGQVLARDRQAMAEWRQRIPAVQQFWERVARRVFRDVEATTDLRLPWKVVVHEDEPDWSAIHADLMDGVDGGIDAVGGIVLMDKPMPQPGRRPLNFPQIWLETPRTGRSLPEMADEAEATGYLADLVQEDIIEEVHGAWPECPRHPHPLEVHYADSAHPMWRCPTTPDTTVAIGELGGPGAAWS